MHDDARHSEQNRYSPWGHIPNGWISVNLGEVLDGIDAGWSPACIETPPSPGEWGVLKVSAVTSGHYLAHESKTLPINLRPRPEIEVRAGDILVARANGVADLVGVCAEVRCTPSRLMLSDKVLRLRTKSGMLEPAFLGFTLKSPSARKQIHSAMSGSSGQKNISQRQIRALIQVLPPLPEQRRIAEVLGTIDEAISQTEQLIQKLKQMKQGLLHDLLTRGLDDRGEMRNLERHPEQFSDSPLGRIHNTWQVTSLGDLYSQPSRNGLYKPPKFHGRGPLMIQMGNIFSSFDVTFERTGRVDVSSTELKNFGLNMGDILFARRSLVFEGAGKCALVRALPEPATFESSIVRVRLDSTRIKPLFAAYFLSSSTSYTHRRQLIRQVAVSGVSSADIAQFKLVVPPLAEQQQICDCLGAVEQRILHEEQTAHKLNNTKKGLMDDLLMGRVLTNVLDGAAA